MIQRLRKLPLPLKALAYAAVAIVLLAVATGMGAMAALLLGPDAGSSGGEPQQEAGSPEEARAQKAGGGENAAGEPQQEEDVPGGAEPQKAVGGENAPKQQEEAAEQRIVASRQDEADYVRTVGEIQAGAVEAFLKSHDSLLRYDALTAADIEEMQANRTALEKLNDRTGDLAPPRKYEEQYGVFSAAIDELHGATRLAYGMAADPVAAAEQGFDEYDGRVNEASDLLLSSNDLLDKEYETIEGVREVSPDF